MKRRRNDRMCLFHIFLFLSLSLSKGEMLSIYSIVFVQSLDERVYMVQSGCELEITFNLL